MPRQKRRLPVGIPIHVTARGNDPRQLFFQDAASEEVRRRRSKAAGEVPVDLDGCNVMPIHLHLAIRQREPCAASACL